MTARTLAPALGLLLSLAGATAHAHPVTVDGVTTTDWLARAPGASNQGLVARDASSWGELIWADATGEARTDIVDTEEGADLQSLGITADATNLYVRIETAGPIVPGAGTPVPQFQIAIDLDRTTSSGQEFLGGFADTTVSPDAHWEYLVQTQATSGSAEVRVWDAGFAIVGTGTIAIVGSTLEMAIPWSLLGLSGPPPVARFTVASFRENASGDTIGLGDDTISNALDVISDYGDPSPGPYANTFAGEVADGDVDYYFDAWFDASGEVYAPLQIASYLYDAGTYPELVTVRNRTGSDLALATYAVGDEETPDGGEGMLAFPTTSLAAGADFVVALGGSTDFTAAFGGPPDAEVTDDDAAVPDMVDLSTYATGSVALANDGDQLLVLGVGRVVLDVITYEGEPYPGIVDAPTAGTDQVTVRDPITQDTDDGSADFRVGDACGGDATCGACGACALFACGSVAPGTGCDDGDACTTGEACDATGACTGGSTVSCDDGNACTDDLCDPASGCANPPFALGTPCLDGDACNGAETCDGAGACTSGTPLDCDDGNACTDDLCDPASGCDNPAFALGTPCPDGDVCNGDETCDGAGTCTTGTPLACDDGNPCTAESCDATTGCTYADVGMGIDCDDGDPCTLGTKCDGAGTCGGGSIAPACVDAGVPDAGVADAGTDAGLADAGSSEDAGAAPTDAGTDAGLADGGTDEDAGLVMEDAGLPTEDAGADEDAGAEDDAAMSLDAAVVPAGDASVDGGMGTPNDGGCSCRVGAPRRARLGGPLAALGLLALALARRRRRR